MLLLSGIGVGAVDSTSILTKFGGIINSSYIYLHHYKVSKRAKLGKVNGLKAPVQFNVTSFGIQEAGLSKVDIPFPTSANI